MTAGVVLEQTDEYWVEQIRTAFPDWRTAGPATVDEVQTLLASGRSRAVRMRKAAFELADQTVAVRTRAVRTTRTETVEQTETLSVADQTEAPDQTEPVRVQTEVRPVRTEIATAPVRSEPQPAPVRQTSRVENGLQIVVLMAVGLMAGAASFTHMHDWTMQVSPAGTSNWFGWTNAIISELGPLAFALEMRRRRRHGLPIGLPATLLVLAGGLSLAAQVSQAGAGLAGWILAAVPALAFMALVKLALSRVPVRA